MEADTETTSVFGPSGFTAWSESGDSRAPITGDRLEEFESEVRHENGIAPLYADVWPAPGFLRLLSKRTSLGDARKVADFVVAWTLASKALGHAATAVEYATYWDLGEATGYRELRAFKAVFPSERNPERLAWALGWVRAPWIPLDDFRSVIEQLLGDDNHE